MGIVKTDIAGYVDANQDKLIGKAVIGGKSASLFSLQTGVKGKQKINLLTADPLLQAGGCGWTPGGSTTVSAREIATGLIKVNEVFCEKDLIGTSLQHEIKMAVGQKVLPFDEDFVAQNLKVIQKKNEETIWRGDTAGSTSSHLERFDGLIKILGAETTVIDATISGVGNTLLLTPKEAIDAMVDKMPDAIVDRDDLAVMVPVEVYKKYVRAIQAANLFHYSAELNGTLEMVIPGTNVTLYGLSGLNGTNKAYATYLENIKLGVDMESDSEVFELFYSKDNAEFRLRVEYNMGVQVAFPDQVVKYTK